MGKGSGWPGDLNLAFVEGLFADYLQNPNSVAEEWRRYFRNLSSENGGNGSSRHGRRIPGTPAPGWRVRPSAPRACLNPAARRREPTAISSKRPPGCKGCVDKLVRNYRVRGHIIAHLDPLGLPRPSPPELDPDYYGLTQADMDRPVSPRTLSGCSPKTVGEIIERLRNTYCRSIGVQFMHIDDLERAATGCRSAWKARRTALQLARERAAPHPHAPDRRGDLRGVHPEEVRRREELFAGRFARA